MTYLSTGGSNLRNEGVRYSGINIVDFNWKNLISTSFKSRQGNGDIPLSARGDGFRRITMMAYFEYLAEEEKKDHQNLIFGMEEPETFLHPSGQEKLFEKLKGMSQSGYQVFISTHSPVLVANSDKEDLIHVKKTPGQYHLEQQIKDLRPIIDDLGVRMENQFISLFDKAKALLLVEGIGDALALKNIANEYKKAGEIASTLDEIGVVVIPIGGCGCIKHWQSLDLLKQLSKPFLVLLDSDITDPSNVSSKIKTLEEYGLSFGSNFLITEKREIENYIPDIALNRIIHEQFGENLDPLSYGDFDDVKAICKKNKYSSFLGGKSVVEKHSDKVSYSEWKSKFMSRGRDEFLEVFNLIKSKI